MCENYCFNLFFYYTIRNSKDKKARYFKNKEVNKVDFKNEITRLKAGNITKKR